TSAHFVQKTNSKDSGSLLSQTLKNLDSIFSFKESKHKKNDKNDELVKKLTEEQLNAKDTKQNLFEQKLNFENLNKTQVVQTKENNTNFNNNTHKEIFIQEQTHGENIDQNSLDELNSLVKDLNKVMQNNTRNITPKETLQHFSQDLKEAVEQYKAPITKLSITLNPNNLGEVEVTLIQRGNNLHINFNSNTNAMNLFIQNQTEFKNSLVNMGFTGLEMNFSDQGKREQNQNQGKNRSRYSFKDALDGKNEGEKINLELVLAKYF
ncbi:TPA: flagellar hook-length control protein FliK, partial [Campylobacter jejuni]|nr:flagellar hook-length control protein FliK [Campylobacter jejuni]